MEGERLKEEVVRSSHAKLEMGNCAVVIGRDDWGTIDLKWLMSHCRWILAHE